MSGVSAVSGVWCVGGVWCLVSGVSAVFCVWFVDGVWCAKTALTRSILGQGFKVLHVKASATNFWLI